MWYRAATNCTGVFLNMTRSKFLWRFVLGLRNCLSRWCNFSFIRVLFVTIATFTRIFPSRRCANSLHPYNSRVHIGMRSVGRPKTNWRKPRAARTAIVCRITMTRGGAPAINALALVAYIDDTQDRPAIRRHFPVRSHFRFFFEFVRPQYEWINHSIAPTDIPDHDFRITTGGPQCSIFTNSCCYGITSTLISRLSACPASSTARNT